MAPRQPRLFETGEPASEGMIYPPLRRGRRSAAGRAPVKPVDDPRDRAIREALAPYLDLEALRIAAQRGHDLRQAMVTHEVPATVAQVVEVLANVLLRPSHRRIERPMDAALPLMAQMGHLDQEELWVLVLSTKNDLLATVPVYRQTVNTAQIRIAEIFRPALRYNAPFIIVAHNHPSGDPEPSPEDITITRALVGMGRELDIEVIDHLIIGHGRYTSLRERGQGFEW